MQASFDDLGTPLHEVTFVVIDLETTGGTAADGGITEIGAVRYLAGERQGTFRSFVNPGCAIPRRVSVLTGITQAMVAPAPPADAVLPTLLEFIGDAVLVGHNVRYDLGYLNAALLRSGRPPLANRSVDTLRLARRLVRDQVPNCKLGTLAQRFGLANQPAHRALDDALATADLLHLLLERAGRIGVCGLDDLVTLPQMGSHPEAAKLRLTDRLPRSAGVYLFRDGGGRTLYVGKATNLRARVRSYFAGDDRRKVGQLLRETERIDHVVCPSPLEAAVLEVRLIHRLEPRFNRQLKTWRRYVYLKLTNERFPRLSVVRTIRDDGALYLGPLPSAGNAKRVAEAIETAVPLRRCTATPGRSTRPAPCAAAQLGVATCPCAGQVSESDYGRLVATVRHGLLGEAMVLLGPLEQKMHALAAAERFEEAADMRDRAEALAAALRRQHRYDTLRRAGRVVIEVGDRHRAELQGGRLVQAWTLSRDGVSAVPLPLDLAPTGPGPLLGAHQDPEAGGPTQEALTMADAGTAQLPPVPRALADELACVAAFLDRQAEKLRVIHADGELVPAHRPLPSFQPTQAH